MAGNSTQGKVPPPRRTTYCCACYFDNYLDRQAFPNAYVSGLREDLGLVANEYSILLSMFSAGSVRIPMVIFAAMQLVTAILLLQPHLTDAGVFTAHYLSATSFIVNPVMYGWANSILQRLGDDAVRSVVLYTMSMSGLLLYTFWGIVDYPATDVPYWKKGAITMVVVCFAYVVVAFEVNRLDDKTKSSQSNNSDDEAVGEVVSEQQMTKIG
ncbi:pantothenate transporter-like protein [Aureobasidium pullulans]|nr:pantothenate transporter-like protein [Aureobasidium pullulans]